MFLDNELTGTFTFLHVLLALLIGLAPIALTIAIKIGLYRRRIAEDEASKPPADGNVHSSVKPKLPRARSANRHRRNRLVRPLSTAFESHQPLALLVSRSRGSKPPVTASDQITNNDTGIPL
jgi:hypothetical protein